MHLSIDKPLGCSVDVEDEHPWYYLNKMFQHTGENKFSYKVGCLLCLPSSFREVNYISHKNITITTFGQLKMLILVNS